MTTRLDDYREIPMNLKACRGFIFALICMLAPPGALAQSEMDEAIAEMEAMVSGMSAFIGDIQFRESDVVSLIELWDEFDAIEGLDAEEESEAMDFDAILGDPAYQAFASSHGLNGRDWLRKAMRITMALYREQVLESAAHMPQQYEQQMQMIEAQKDQLGEDMYEQMKAAMDEGRVFVDLLVSTAKRLPQPTAAEAEVLDTYREQLYLLLMDADDEFVEEDWGGEDDEDYDYSE